MIKRVADLFFFVFCLFFIFCLPAEVLAASPETFISTGTFTPGTGFYAVDAACWGGGGAGGGSTTATSKAGGGGGGGGYSKSIGIGVTPGNEVTVTVGVGGTCAVAGTDGGSGGDSWFYTAGTILAKGGVGGKSQANLSIGGSGGLASVGIGDSRYSGGNGFTPSANGGGGGGSAGTGSNGNNASSATGASAVSGGGAGGNGGGNHAIGGSAPVPGPGGGGGGAGHVQSAALKGGAGYFGKCIVSYTDTWAPSTTLAIYSPTWSFASVPTNQSATAIGMTATTGYDSTTINYLFTTDNTPCGVNAGIGGTSSSWQASTSYTNDSLQPNKCYGYKVTAKDPTYTGTVSDVSYTYTSANTPGTPALGGATLTTLSLTNDENINSSTNPVTNFAVQVVTTTDDTWIDKWVNASGNPAVSEDWMTDTALDNLTLNNLQIGTTYGVRVKAKNEDGDETVLSAEGYGTTQSIAVSITRTTDGLVDFDFVGLGQTASTTSAQKETVSVDSGPATLKVRSTLFSQGGNEWTLGTSSGDNRVKWEFSKDTGSWTTFEVVDNPYDLETSVPQGESRDLYLRITMPIETASYETYSATVTIVASTP